VTVAVTVRELAEWVQGEVIGDGEQLIAAARPLREAESGDLTFVEDEKYLAQFHTSPAAAAIVSPAIPVNGKTLIRVKDPLTAFISVIQKLHPKKQTAFSGVHRTAQIHPSVQLGSNVAIGSFVAIGQDCVVGDGCKLHAGVVVGNFCRLGKGVTLYPHVVLYDGCVLGESVIVHANAVIGADGFGYRAHAGRHVKVPQLGRVEIADDVEIGACTTIDRGTFGATRIGLGTKIDNLVMIGHNCQIGRHNLIVSQVGIAGSCTTGDYVVMAGQAGIADHIHVGDRSQLGAQCGVHKDVPPDIRMLGSPATPDKEQMRIMMTIEKLPELRKDIRRLKQHLGLADEG
jgi:UDP-3-O-[3-hydroxymyristoyl] glucosamine N-acyltransferase